MKDLIWILLLVFGYAGTTQAVECGVKITFDGKGAGKVVFDGTLHAAKGLLCSDCHERQRLTPALFDMKKGANVITMRKMEMGRSCGYCHEATKLTSCSKCHLK